MSALEHIDEIEDISGAAQGERSILNTLSEVKKRWEDISFTVVQYREIKDRYIITEVEDLVTQLEDDTMNVSTMMGSKFVAEVKNDVEQMERKLVYLAYVIDEWLKFQRQWMYLENIFNAEDIIKQLPAEAKMFQLVDKQWKEHMVRAFKSPKALAFAADYETQINLKRFQDNNKRFDEIQKCLEEYLGTKRAAFPRFYFLSNDEMLEILS
jgi:dynein heavy chain, axonemal